MRKITCKKIWQHFNKPFWTPLGVMGMLAWAGSLATQTCILWIIFSIIWIFALWISLLRDSDWGRKILKLDE